MIETVIVDAPVIVAVHVNGAAPVGVAEAVGAPASESVDPIARGLDHLHGLVPVHVHGHDHGHDHVHGDGS